MPADPEGREPADGSSSRGPDWTRIDAGLRAVVAQLGVLHRFLCKADDTVLELRDQIEVLRKTRDGAPLPSSASSRPRSSFSSGRSGSERILKQAAEKGASSIEFRPDGEGGAAARVDGGDWFQLPPMLAKLLWALSLDVGKNGDAFVPWKSNQQLAELLGRPGRPYRKANLANLVWRLRRALVERGALNMYLVQTCPGRGRRFRVLRTGAPPAGYLPWPESD